MSVHGPQSSNAPQKLEPECNNFEINVTEIIRRLR
jgi:hypothetical protein